MTDRLTLLEGQVSQLRTELQSAKASNDRLANTLREAREQLIQIRSEVERLSIPPSGYATVIAAHDLANVDISFQGRQFRVIAMPGIDPGDLLPGRQVRLNESQVIIAVADFEDTGEVVAVREILDDGLRLLVMMHTDEERIVRLAQPMRGVRLRIGDSVLLDSKSGFVYDRIAKPDVEDLILEEVPDIDYEDIGGLTEQIEAIRDAVEMPFLHPELFIEHDLAAPKGILLYGPPGCGKTLIAKAVAKSLAQQVAARTGNTTGKSYFLNVKGPELLNKFVGETERHIRTIFHRAREKASDGMPVIVFFDEMDSLFRTRGTGVSSDVETTIVPQLLAEIDGVERLSNVIVIGASNREDMIDPAILRPGRLDVKIKIERPDKAAARDIMSKYLRPDLPLHEEEVARHGGDRVATSAALIDAAIDYMYALEDHNRFLEVTYANGDKEVLYFKDFNSGAMLENIVRRAKKAAIKDLLAGIGRGLREQHLIDACAREFRENEDLPNTTNPDDWARISGKKGERIVFIRTLIDGASGSGRAIESSQSNGRFL
jgi:proteasome-associated ATPase